MKHYIISGMSCAACAARIEKAVAALDGVESCAVSLLTNEMGVEGEVSEEAVISAVERAGYGAALKGTGPSETGGPAGEEENDPLADRQTPLLKRRFFLSLGFLAALMLVSKFEFGFQGAVQALLALTVMYINRAFFVNGFKGLFHGAANMDTLVALGSGAAFVFSLVMLIRGNREQFYFDSSAMILTLITVGKMLEARSKGKTTDALRSLMKIVPKTAKVIRNGREIELPVEEVNPGDVFAVYAGGRIPVDGVVVDGNAAVDESALTGESLPVDKSGGDSVSTGTVNVSGYIRCRATAVGEDTSLAGIIRLVTDASATKAPISRIADKVAGVFVPVVIAIAAVTAAVWIILGSGAGFALARGVSVLVISCPCALGLATPVAIMVASGKGAKNGILFKTASAIEEIGRVSIVVLDKTGTITAGKPKVTDVIPAEGIESSELLKKAYALESLSDHPLAGAVSGYCEELFNGEKPERIDSFEVLPGNGLCGISEEKTVIAGSMEFVSGRVPVSALYMEKAKSLAEKGKTPLLFAADDCLLGMIAVADVLKSDSSDAISELKSMGLRVIMLTGDNERTARAIGSAAGIDEVIAGVLPSGKAEAVATLCREGKVAMVGDGINDAPALSSADVGIAVGAGTDVAMDAAEVVLVKSSLLDVAAAVKIGRAALKNIRQNLFWAFFYNSVAIPVAAGVFSKAGIMLNPMIAAACMSLSSICVVSNALRLNLIKLYNTKEKKIMTRTMTVEGMMCQHCEARVKKALEALPGVESASPDHVSGKVEIVCDDTVSAEMLTAVVSAQDYAVTGIE